VPPIDSQSSKIPRRVAALVRQFLRPITRAWQPVTPIFLIARCSARWSLPDFH